MPAQTAMIEPLPGREIGGPPGRQPVRPAIHPGRAELCGGGRGQVGGRSTAHADQFERKIFTIEPGAAVNENVRRMLDGGAYGLTGWEMVGPSEQGVLGQVDRAIRGKEWILFIAWEPHPMNTKLDFTYLPGADDLLNLQSRQRHGPDLSRTAFPADAPTWPSCSPSSVSPRRWRTR